MCSWAARAGLLVTVVALSASSVSYVVAKSAAEVDFSDPEKPKLGDDVNAAQWLRDRVLPGELVLRHQPFSAPYIRSGLHMAGPVKVRIERALGAPLERIAKRKALLDDCPDSVQPYLSEGIRWLVVASTERRRFESASAWERMGQAELKESFGNVRIFRLMPTRR